MRTRCALALVWLLAACTPEPPPLTPLDEGRRDGNSTPLDPQVEEQIWRVKGDRIVDGRGETIHLRGIAFGNEVWDHVAIPSAHHTGADFGVVRSMGMNSVRFYLSYRSFEEDDRPFRYKQSGWDWLDQNVEWAKKYGIRLVLNLHAPPGGYQSGGEGDALWEDPRARERFVALWRAIAERYRAEPTIAGYDLLNEPAPVESIAQWKMLAEQTIAEIRAVDQHHMIFVERANAVGGDWSENEHRNFFRVEDPNVVYEFHFYKPFHFTHQSAEWSDFAAREAWYPEERVVGNDWFQLKLEAKAESEPLPPGDSEWILVETEPFQVYEGPLRVGKPFLVCDRSGGKAYFDSLSLTRIGGGPKKSPSSSGGGADATDFDAERPVETLFEIDLDTRRGWYFWEEQPGGVADFEPEGHGDETSISIAQTTGQAALGSDPLRFFLQPGSEYTLQALAKGESLADDANCRLRLEFYSSEVPVLPYSKAFLEQELSAYLQWGREQEVPLYLGEFGTIRQSFLPGRGGLRWVGDMLDLIGEHQLHFAYHAYHETAFGLFIGSDGLPTRWALFQPLYDLLTEKLGGSGKPPWADSESRTPNRTENSSALPEAPAPQEEAEGSSGSEGVMDFD